MLKNMCIYIKLKNSLHRNCERTSISADVMQSSRSQVDMKRVLGKLSATFCISSSNKKVQMRCWIFLRLINLTSLTAFCQLAWRKAHKPAWRQHYVTYFLNCLPNRFTTFQYHGPPYCINLRLNRQPSSSFQSLVRSFLSQGKITTRFPGPGEKLQRSAEQGLNSWLKR